MATMRPPQVPENSPARAARGRCPPATRGVPRDHVRGPARQRHDPALPANWHEPRRAGRAARLGCRLRPRGRRCAGQGPSAAGVSVWPQDRPRARPLPAGSRSPAAGGGAVALAGQEGAVDRDRRRAGRQTPRPPGRPAGYPSTPVPPHLRPPVARCRWHRGRSDASGRLEEPPDAGPLRRVSRQMLARDGTSAADERAREAYKRLSSGDRL
jgi:hypothetical protein